MAIDARNADTPLHESEQAARFIDARGLGGTVERVWKALSTLARNGQPISEVDVDVDDLDPEIDRLLVTVVFEGDMPSAYSHWQEVWPSLATAVPEAEVNELVGFEFTPRRA